MGIWAENSYKSNYQNEIFKSNIKWRASNCWLQSSYQYIKVYDCKVAVQTWNFMYGNF